MPNVAHILDDKVTAAMRAAYPDVTDAPAIVMPSSDPRFGDYQANGAMGLAKHLKIKPRDVAQAIVAKLDISDLCDPPEIAGPGFINLRLRAEWLSRQIGLINVPFSPAQGPEAAAEAAGYLDRLGVEKVAQPRNRRRRLLRPEPGERDARRSPPLDNYRRRPRPHARLSPATRSSARTTSATGGRSLGCLWLTST